MLTLQQQNMSGPKVTEEEVLLVGMQHGWPG